MLQARTEQTFVMLKPDAVQRNIIGVVIDRFLSKVWGWAAGGQQVVAAAPLELVVCLCELRCGSITRS